MIRVRGVHADGIVQDTSEGCVQVAEWTKQVSARWRELTSPLKEQYQAMAASDKARYNSQVYPT